MRPLTLIALLGPLLVACEEDVPDPFFEFGTVLGDLELEIISDTMGVHPDRSILFDPNNPFRNGVSIETKFQMVDAENGPGPVPGFYAAATALAIEPTGENQFLAASQAQAIFEQRRVDDVDLAVVRKLAITGYQTVLDEFPGAVTFDGTGRVPFDLMAPTIEGILALGGTPENGWYLAVGPDGQTTIAVQSGVTDDD